MTARFGVAKILSSELWFDLSLHQVKPVTDKYVQIQGFCRSLFCSTPEKTTIEARELTRQRSPIQGDVKSPSTGIS